LERELMAKKPLSRLEQLRRMQEAAIDREDFERAALLRDELKKLAGEE
jgi:protein-arginine kinase activator protein McsA